MQHEFTLGVLQRELTSWEERLPTKEVIKIEEVSAHHGDDDAVS